MALHTDMRGWRGLGLLPAAALGMVCVITFVDVIGRYLLATTLPGGADVSARLQAFTVFWGMALVCLDRAHICVDLLYERLQGRAAASVQGIADACTGCFFALAAIAAAVQIPKHVRSGERLPGVDVPAWPFIVLACCGLACAVAAVLRARRVDTGLGGGDSGAI